jgi:hypothetical protein
MSDNLDTNLPKVVGRPWAVGNPGRKPGSRNKSTVRAEQFKSKDTKEVAAIVMAAAKKGEEWAVKYVMPQPKERRVTFPWRPIESKEDIGAAYDGLWAAVSSGQILISEAKDLANLLDRHARHLGANDIEERLAKLEGLKDVTPP